MQVSRMARLQFYPHQPGRPFDEPQAQALLGAVINPPRLRYAREHLQARSKMVMVECRHDRQLHAAARLTFII